MKTSSLDILESSELPDTQARAILKVLEQEMTSVQENLVTKAELRTELALLRADMNALGSKLSWMVLTCFLTQLAVTLAVAGALYVRLGR